MDVKTKMVGLVAASRQVIHDTLLPNGAIVASNGDMPYAANGTNNYHYVWPRDAAFIMYAGRLLGLDIAEPFCRWLLDRAESFHELGLFSRRYATHGPCNSPEAEYQPDQSGALLWALCASDTHLTPGPKAVIEITANTLCQTWVHDRFSASTFDPWEQFTSNEQAGSSFVYTLACCSYGLRLAHERHPQARSRWLTVANEMRAQLEKYGNKTFTRQTVDDQRIDASLLGLVWPFRVTDNTHALEATVEHITTKLKRDNGILRFEQDIYDGAMRRSQDLMQGAGTWPLLTCWYAIALHEFGHHAEARSVYEKLTADLPDTYIPEQLLPDDRRSPAPLGWSHAMYVVAYHHLGYATAPTHATKKIHIAT